MDFSVNFVGVVIAAIAGVIINALWYSVLLKDRVATLRGGDATIAGRDPAGPMYGVAVVGQFLMAFVLAFVLKVTNVSGIGGGAIVGALLWLGFTLPGMAQVHTFGYRNREFIFVDGAAWLIAAVVMGAILGAFP